MANNFRQHLPDLYSPRFKHTRTRNTFKHVKNLFAEVPSVRELDALWRSLYNEPFRGATTDSKLADNPKLSSIMLGRNGTTNTVFNWRAWIESLVKSGDIHESIRVKTRTCRRRVAALCYANLRSHTFSWGIPEGDLCRMNQSFSGIVVLESENPGIDEVHPAHISQGFLFGHDVIKYAKLTRSSELYYWFTVHYLTCFTTARNRKAPLL